LARLAGMPGIGTRYELHEPLHAGLRYYPITRHRNFIVFYRPIPGGIEVLRVLHGARNLPEILADEFGGDQEPDTGEDQDEPQPG
jgi:toxin ParE1/3/4